MPKKEFFDIKIDPETKDLFYKAKGKAMMNNTFEKATNNNVLKYILKQYLEIGGKK